MLIVILYSVCIVSVIFKFLNIWLKEKKGKKGKKDVVVVVVVVSLCHIIGVVVTLLFDVDYFLYGIIYIYTNSIYKYIHIRSTTSFGVVRYVQLNIYNIYIGIFSSRSFLFCCLIFFYRCWGKYI